MSKPWWVRDPCVVETRDPWNATYRQRDDGTHVFVLRHGRKVVKTFACRAYLELVHLLAQETRSRGYAHMRIRLVEGERWFETEIYGSWQLEEWERENNVEAWPVRQWSTRYRDSSVAVGDDLCAAAKIRWELVETAAAGR